MAGKKKTSSVPVPSAGVPSSGQRPLLRPEAAGYDELAARISAHVKPSDPIEELYTRDTIDLTWDLQRYRRTKERVIESAVCRALVEKLAPFVNGHFRFGDIPRFTADGAREPTPAMELVNDWMNGKPKAIDRVDKVLASAKLTMEDVRAHAFLLELGTIEKFDRLIASLEVRRNGILREIERYRALLAHSLRAASNEAEEGEFEVVTHRSPAPEVHEH